MATSYSALPVKDQVQLMYVAYFGRAGDPGGVDHWIHDINVNHFTIEQVGDSFALQSEAKGKYTYLAYPNLGDPKAFVKAIYSNLFERTPADDDYGLKYWVDRLTGTNTNGTNSNGEHISAGTMIAAIINGAYANTAGPNHAHDVASMENKIQVANYFTQKLIDNHITWDPATMRDDAAACIDNVTWDSATIATGKNTVDASVNAFVAESGQTFTLTPASGQVTEGTALSFTLKAAQKVVADTTFTVGITGDDDGGTLGKASAADFPANVVSSVTIKAGSDSATFDLTPVANDGTEGLEGFKVILLDSANKTVANSGVVAIKDGVTDITAPVVDANQSFTYAENQAKDYLVGTVKASDVGVGGGAGTVATFEIAGGNDNGFFAIDKNGKITLTEAGADKTKAANDFETTPNTFTLKVRAIDAAGNKSADTDVTITVTDLDDTGPKFVSAAASGTQVKINFDEALKTVALSDPSALFTITQGSTSYSVNTATISGNTVTLTLASTLGSGDTFIAYNGTVLEDALGNKADKFDPTKVTSTDLTPPTLSSSNPADNATDFAANANLTLTFNEAVKLGTGAITLVNTSDANDNRVINVQDSAQVSVSGNTVTINPTADLKENASYAVNISATAILDSADNAFAGISDNTTLNFTTKAAILPGQAFTLTTAADNVVGTAGDDKIGGTNSAAGTQFSAADAIDGGDGVDTLVLDLNNDYNGGATIKNVEVLQITTDDANGASAATFDTNGIAGLTKIVRIAGDAQGVAFNNVSSLAALEIQNTNADTTISYLESAVAGATDSVAVTLNNVTGGAWVNIDSATGNTGGVETVAITATGLASNVILRSNDTSVSKLTIAGSSNLTLTVGGANVPTTATTIDANDGYTGQLTLAGMGAANHTITGGSGNDRFQFGPNFTSADKVDGGNGVDTLSANGAQLAAITTKLADVKSIETLELADDVGTTETTVNAANFGSITNVRISNQGSTNAANVTFNNITAAAAGASNNIRFDGDLGATGGTYNFNIKGATDPGTANAVTLDMRGAATTATSTIKLAGVETITIDTSNATGTQTFNLGAAFLKTLTVKGIQSVDIDGAALGANVESVDASGLTAGGLNVLLNNAAATGANIVGSGQDDLVAGSNLKDIISLGGGTDIVVTSGGQDKITLGGGVDIVRLGVAATVAGANGANMISVVDFVAGTDVFSIKSTGTANEVLTGVTFNAANAAMAAMNDAITSTTAVNSATDVYTQLGAVLTAGTFAASEANGTATVARVVEFTQGDAAGKYLVINNATDGFQGASDIVINITGVSGTISAADFTFSNF